MIGFNLVTYKGFVKNEEEEPKDVKEDEKIFYSNSEGAYTFKMKPNETG